MDEKGQGGKKGQKKIAVASALAVVAALLVLSLLFAPFGKDAPTPGADTPAPESSRDATELASKHGDDPLARRTMVSGFRFSGTRGGEPVVRISGERLVTRKKKVGFFRVGIAREAVVEDGVVELWADKESGRYRAGYLFSDEVLGRLPGRAAGSLGFSPIVLRIRAKDRVLVEITGETGRLRLGDADFVVTGTARAVSGKTTLTAGRILVNPAEGVVVARDGVALTGGGTRRTAQNLVADFTLEVLDRNSGPPGNDAS
ncbi:MAG: hypothetical protein ACLFOY_15005 [Desulfatibacillaceae bacterium]